MSYWGVYIRAGETRTLYLNISVLLVMIVLLIPSAGAATPAPDFTLQDLDGSTFSLGDFRGKVVVLDFMASWCGSCEIVEGNLKEIYSEYGDEIQIISIDIDNKGDSVDFLRGYKEEHSIPWTMAMDTDQLLLKYSVNQLPKVVVVDKDGYMTFEGTGVVTVSELRSEVEKARTGQASPINARGIGLFALAVVAGVGAFFSPCSFPMLPGFVTYYLGLEQEKREAAAGEEKKEEAEKGSAKRGGRYVKRAVFGGGASALGIVLVYTLVGLVVVALGSLVTPYVTFMEAIVGAILIILGILMFTNVQYNALFLPFQRLSEKLQSFSERKKEKSESNGYSLKLFVYGIGYGAASAGCTAPLFIAIILTASVSGSLTTGIAVFLVFTLSSAVLMIIVAVLVAVLGRKAVSRLSARTETIKRVSAAVLVIVGLYLIIYYLLGYTGVRV